MQVACPSGVPFVFVTRGEFVESVHAVAACAVDARGVPVLAVGDVDVPVFVRSAAKPFITAAIVESGAAERYGFSAPELAVITASHNGEPFHVAAVRGILDKIGLEESALRCGAHPPSYEPAAAALVRAGIEPTAVHNNCSGKHAGILAMCVHLGFDLDGYLEPAHPAERRILAFCARVLGQRADELSLGTDGCGIPVFATGLRRTAHAFAKLATLAGLSDGDARALAAVRDAVAAAPAYLGGTGRFDSALVEATGGRIIGKAGAEGVRGDALRREGLGLALKVIDGHRRAMPPAAVALLAELGALEPGERDALAPFASVEVRNVAGRPVGSIEARVPDTISTAAAS